MERNKEREREIERKIYVDDEKRHEMIPSPT